MDLSLLKTMILSIIFMGVVILPAGVIFLLYKQQVAPYMRYLLPIPPIGVASYVFVYNMFAKYEGHLPGTALVTFIEIAWASGISPEYQIEKYLRDAKIPQLWLGGQQISAY